MHDVFISYSSKDKYIADGICANLEANAIKCWYAPRDIEPGKEWSESIMNALQKSKVFVLVFSSNSNRSDQVYNEITSAIKYGCRIIPFCVDSVEMEVRLAYYLNAVHWLDATNKDLLNSIEKLYGEIYCFLHHNQPTNFVRVPVKRAKKKLWRNLIIAAVSVSAVFLLTAILALALIFWLAKDSNPETHSAQVGDIIEFGTIENEPIEWKVVDTEGDRILVVSREGLYSAFYNMHQGLCTWESCTLRSDLNSEYYDLWFTEEEKENIFETHIENPDNTLYETDGGNSTRDRLFILSVDEVLKYFPEQEDRKLMGAGYLGRGSSDYSPWWVRNPGEDLNSALYVDEDGIVSYENSIDMEMGMGNALAGYFLVRPAMWIKYDGAKVKETTTTPAKKISYSKLATAKQGDIVEFGRYEQDNNTANGSENIKWVVLETTDIGSTKNLTLISKDCLDCIYITQANHGYNLWYDCIARDWLNNTFYSSAFNTEERNMIEPNLIETVDLTQTPSQTVKTSDNVIFLNKEQYERYSHIPAVSKLSPSAYAREKNSNIDGWWLTDTYYPNYSPDSNYIVNSSGEVTYAMQKFYQYARPVITVKVDK